MVLLFDVGNTHTHLGLVRGHRIIRQRNVPTPAFSAPSAGAILDHFVRKAQLGGAALCSVVPQITAKLHRVVRSKYKLPILEVGPNTVRTVGIDYPRPETIGADRLANAVAVKRLFGTPAVVVDFGTAVTFDVVDRAGNYVGGIIAPGLAAMTSYLHEKTALLPKIRIQNTEAAIGKSTKEAMLIGAVHGYRGLVKELISRLKRELGVSRLPVIATGGYAELIATDFPHITAVAPLLTLEGVRLVWEVNQREKPRDASTTRVKR